MDRYDRIIRDVQQKTDDESIRWEVVNAEQYAAILLNPSRVIRSFVAGYQVSEDVYTILFVERKVDFYHDLGNSSEGFGYELFVLDSEDQIVLSLYDGVVDRDDLLRLSGLIDAHNNRVKHFFDAFDAS